MQELRREYHLNICRHILGYRAGTSVFSNADKDSPGSVFMARGIAERIGADFCPDPPSGQGAGSLFAAFTHDFLVRAFETLHHLRPGPWTFSTSQSGVGIAAYDQYRHLAELAEVLERHPNLKAALGGDYFITPDILIAREPVTDEAVNSSRSDPLVAKGDCVASLTPLREENHRGADAFPILHASISCKWTMRSDRSQNTRTEALNLLRNRKGKTPHIVVVTAEPTPMRIASIAMGTGDIDCTYHMALPELRDALEADTGLGQAREMLEMLEGGRRLRDISDLPFDLAT